MHVGGVWWVIWVWVGGVLVGGQFREISFFDPTQFVSKSKKLISQYKVWPCGPWGNIECVLNWELLQLYGRWKLRGEEVTIKMCIVVALNVSPRNIIANARDLGIHRDPAWSQVVERDCHNVSFFQIVRFRNVVILEKYSIWTESDCFRI